MKSHSLVTSETHTHEPCMVQNVSVQIDNGQILKTDVMRATIKLHSLDSGVSEYLLLIFAHHINFIIMYDKSFIKRCACNLTVYIIQTINQKRLTNNCTVYYITHIKI